MIRSLLYVPANAPKFVAKAHERGADAIILDLEDAVVPAEKEAARAALAEAVPAVGRAGATVFVRINAATLEPDAIAACQAGAAGVMVPKVQRAETLQRLAATLDPHETGRKPLHFVPLLEDPGAILDARPILTRSPRILGVSVGAEDLATAMDAEPTADLLRLPKLLVHLAAKAAGVLSWGMMRSVASWSDTDALAASAREAAALGFDGASAIHPAAIPILNAAFSPDPAALDRARRMIAAFDAAAGDGRGAFTFEGKMVDLPVVERAKRLVRRAGGA